MKQKIFFAVVLTLSTLTNFAQPAKPAAPSPARPSGTISGFAPNAVSGFTPGAVSGHAPNAVRGFTPLPRSTVAPTVRTGNNLSAVGLTPNITVIPPNPVQPVQSSFSQPITPQFPAGATNRVVTPLF